MIDLRKKFGNLPENTKYDKARHSEMDLRRMFRWDLISLPNQPKGPLICRCGKPTNIKIYGDPVCTDCLACRIREYARDDFSKKTF